MTNTELIIRKSSFNWLNIIKLTLDRKNWGLKHVLYTLDNVTISATMDSFNFRHRVADFITEIEYVRNNIMIKKCNWVSCHINNYERSDFKRLLKISIIKDLNLILNKDVEDIATEKFKINKVHKEDISLDIIQKSKYNQDYILTTQLSEKMKERTRNRIIETLLDDSNMLYTNLIKEYTKANQSKLYAIISLLKTMTEEK